MIKKQVIEITKSKNKIKGFIGSIGDDLPSLVPLFFALMIFFASLAFAFSTINTRNATINTYVDSLTIAKSALSDASFSGINEFKATQNGIVTMSNYIYGIVYISKNNSFNFETELKTNFKDLFVKECDDNSFKISSESNIYLDKHGGLSNFINCNSQIDKTYVAGSSSAIQKLTQNSDNSLYDEIVNRKYYYYMYPITVLTPKGYMIFYMFILVW